MIHCTTGQSSPSALSSESNNQLQYATFFQIIFQKLRQHTVKLGMSTEEQITPPAKLLSSLCLWGLLDQHKRRGEACSPDQTNVRLLGWRKKQENMSKNILVLHADYILVIS